MKKEKEKLTKNQKKMRRMIRQAEKKQKKLHHSAFARLLTGGRSNRSMAGSVALLLFLFLLALLMLFPVVFMVSNAFKPINELFIFPPRQFVIQPTLDNFYDLSELLADSLVPFSRYLFNTLFIVVLGSVGHILLSCMAAFPLAPFLPQQEARAAAL